MQNYFLRIILLAVILASIAGFIALEAAASNPAGNPGGGTGQPGTPVDASGYLSNLYKWLLGAVGISALFAFVMGGVLYMFSGTNLTKVEQAKGWIWNGLGGIVLAAISYLLLYTINPDLVGGFDLNKVIEKAVNSGQQK